VDLLKLWQMDATSMFTRRNKGDMQVDMFKVVGAKQVLFIANVFAYIPFYCLIIDNAFICP